MGLDREVGGGEGRRGTSRARGEGEGEGEGKSTSQRWSHASQQWKCRRAGSPVGRAGRPRRVQATCSLIARAPHRDATDRQHITPRGEQHSSADPLHIATQGLAAFVQLSTPVCARGRALRGHFAASNKGRLAGLVLAGRLSRARCVGPWFFAHASGEIQGRLPPTPLNPASDAPSTRTCLIAHMPTRRRIHASRFELDFGIGLGSGRQLKATPAPCLCEGVPLGAEAR